MCGQSRAREVLLVCDLAIALALLRSTPTGGSKTRPLKILEVAVQPGHRTNEIARLWIAERAPKLKLCLAFAALKSRPAGAGDASAVDQA